MKEIDELILKEKNKTEPNKEYIQWLQQLSDKKELTAYFIEQVKEKNFLHTLYKSQVIQWDRYFPYSGKVEETKSFSTSTPYVDDKTFSTISDVKEKEIIECYYTNIDSPLTKISDMLSVNVHQVRRILAKHFANKRKGVN